MSQTLLVNSLIFEGLQYNNAPATIAEYNALAPKRQNPVLEDAIDDIMKHKVLSQFRNKFLDHVEEKFKDLEGIARRNSGTEKTPVWEKDMVYIARVVGLIATSRDLNPSDKSVQNTIASELFADAERILNEQKFNVAEREPSDGPSVAKTYTSWAEDAFKKGIQDKLLSLLNGTAGNASFAFVGDAEKDTATLAKAIAGNEKRKRDIETAKAKSEYGLSEVTA